MVDYLIHQQMPKSTLDYMIRRAAKESVFYLPERSRSTALQDHIDKEGERNTTLLLGRGGRKRPLLACQRNYHDGCRWLLGADSLGWRNGSYFALCQGAAG